MHHNCSFPQFLIANHHNIQIYCSSRIVLQKYCTTLMRPDICPRMASQVYVTIDLINNGRKSTMGIRCHEQAGHHGTGSAQLPLILPTGSHTAWHFPPQGYAEGNPVCMTSYEGIPLMMLWQPCTQFEQICNFQRQFHQTIQFWQVCIITPRLHFMFSLYPVCISHLNCLCDSLEQLYS